MSVEFTCDGCGKKAAGFYAGQGWHKPRIWYERSDKDGAQTACSRECIEKISAKIGKTKVVLPI